MDQKTYETGLRIRSEVLGKEYVDNSMKNADDFNRPFQEFVSEYCWGAGWGREGLSKKERSMLNLAMIAILNRPQELKLHVRGVLTNGLTKEQIREIFIHMSIYAGIPAGVDAFRQAREVYAEQKKYHAPWPGLTRPPRRERHDDADHKRDGRAKPDHDQ